MLKVGKRFFPYPQPPPPLLSHLPQPRLSECVPVSMCCWSIAVKHRITIIVFFHRLQTGQLDPIALSKSANGSCLLSLSRSIDSRYGNNFLSLSRTHLYVSVFSLHLVQTQTRSSTFLKISSCKKYKFKNIFSLLCATSKLVFQKKIDRYMCNNGCSKCQIAHDSQITATPPFSQQKKCLATSCHACYSPY